MILYLYICNFLAPLFVGLFYFHCGRHGTVRLYWLVPGFCARSMSVSGGGRYSQSSKFELLYINACMALLRLGGAHSFFVTYLAFGVSLGLKTLRVRKCCDVYEIEAIALHVHLSHSLCPTISEAWMVEMNGLHAGGFVNVFKNQ